MFVRARHGEKRLEKRGPACIRSVWAFSLAGREEEIQRRTRWPLLKENRPTSLESDTRQIVQAIDQDLSIHIYEAFGGSSRLQALWTLPPVAASPRGTGPSAACASRPPSWRVPLGEPRTLQRSIPRHSLSVERRPETEFRSVHLQALPQRSRGMRCSRNRPRPPPRPRSRRCRRRHKGRGPGGVLPTHPLHGGHQLPLGLGEGAVLGREV